MLQLPNRLVMETISDVKVRMADSHSKKRVDPFFFKPHLDGGILDPIELDLLFKQGYVESSDYYKMGRPILFLELIAGRIPTKIVSGWMRFSYLSWPFAYSVLVTISYMLLTIYYKQDLIRSWKKLCSSEVITFENILFSCLVLMQVPVSCIRVYSWIFEIPKIVNCFNMTAVVEKRISDVFPSSTLSKRTIRIIPIAVVLYFVVTMIVGIILLSSRFNEASWFTIFTFVWGFIMAHSICISWCFNFIYVRHLASKLKDHMVMFEGMNIFFCLFGIVIGKWIAWDQTGFPKLNNSFGGSSCPETVQPHCATYGFLGGEMGFLVSVIYLLINNGALFVISTYGMIVSIQAGSFTDILASAPYFFNSFLNVASVLETAHHATNKLGEDFLCTLMTMDKDTLDHESNEEVDRFMRIINFTENGKITLKGYVSVDRSLLVSFLSYSITYLIVLIQFQGKGDGQTNETGPTNLPLSRLEDF